MPQAPTAERPATLDEIITAVAKANGVAPALALAVAKRESNMDPATVGDGGQALGLFQLHPGAAADTGTANRADPFQNITGGVKYLRQLNDRYQGDVQKVLQAYNGGMDGVDKGTVSPAAQAYASDVLANLSGASRAQATAPTKPAAALTPEQAAVPAYGKPSQSYLAQKSDQYGVPLKTPAPPKPGMLRQLVEPFNPHTTEGRVNIASGVAAGAFTAATEGLGAEIAPAVGEAVTRGVLPWIVRVLGPPTAAGLAGAGQMTLEKKAGAAPADASPTRTGLTQAAYEGAGQGIAWGAKTFIAKPFLATSIGRSAKAYLEDLTATVASANERLMASARQQASDVMSSAAMAKDELLGHARQVSGRLTAAVKQHAAEHAAQVELDNTALVKEATDALTTLSQAPSVRGAADAVKDVVQGQPGLLGGDAGPATRALRQAGQQIEQVAQDGPALKTAALKEALNAMGIDARPPALFQGEASSQARGIGFARNISAGRMPAIAAASRGAGGSSADEASNFAKIIAAQLGVAENHPLPGILGQIQAAPDEVSFADMHQLKRLLDEAVDWDVTAKKHLTQITKGIRGTLRDEMSTYEPYNAATQAYADIVPLFRRGVGLKAIKAAAQNPDEIAKLLKPDAPQQAGALKRLLVDMSAQGGRPEDAQIGQRAWQAVREQYGYRELESQGIEGLTQRVQDLVTKSPEFAREVFGDLDGQQYLSRLSRIGDAYEAAVALAKQNTGIAKSAGRVAVAQAKEVGRVGTQEAMQVAKASTRAARQDADTLIRDAKSQVKAASGAVADQVSQFRASTVNPDALNTNTANEIRAFLGRGAFRAIGLLRLLSSAKSSDIIEWAARSNANNQRLVRALLSPVPDRFIADVIRDGLGLTTTPSHAPTPASPPAAVK